MTLILACFLAQFLKYLKETEKFGQLVEYLEANAISDLISRIISMEINDQSHPPVEKNFFKEERINLINVVIESISKSENQEVLLNSAQILIDLLKRQNICDKEDMHETLFSPKNLEAFFRMLESKEIDKFSASVNVLLEMSNHCRSHVEENENNESMEAREKVSAAIEKHKRQFYQTFTQMFEAVLSQLDISGETYTNTIGLLVTRVGLRKLRTVQLLTAAVLSDELEILTRLSLDSVFSRVFKIFLEVQWNNYFHTIALKFLVACLESPCYIIKKDIIESAQIPKLLLEAIQNSTVHSSNNKIFKAGNLGHIIQLGTILERRAQSCPDFEPLFKGSPLSFCFDFFIGISTEYKESRERVG